ncbi:protein-disulfide reductase DsbD family protein [Pseudodesulfovibrio cashew]|nr:cytochrome c biogenesis protein CcdA [Pseudodesulfovibrio cashew]
MHAFRTEAGETVITLSLDMEPDWYAYSNVPGEMGKPTQLTGTTADGKDLTVVYPKGVRKPDTYDPSIMVNKYLSGTKLFIILPKGGTLPASLRLELLLCHPTKCVPVRRDLTFGEGIDTASLPPAEKQEWWPAYQTLASTTSDKASQTEALPPEEETFATWDFSPRYLQPGLEVTGLLSAVLMGLLAGLILNIMPCVLPVVSLKLSALLNSTAMESEEERIQAFREHNTFFALGILTFFLVLAVVLGATGQAWGALFQKQWLVLGVALVIMALSLSLFGLFHLPVIDLKFGNESRNPRVQAFFTGNLTTLLATPCSGPFLGGVLSWALVQGGAVIATVFISIGVGMASPYILLIVNPRLSRFLPKSGPWIEYVEKGIAFFLVGTAFYLAGIALGTGWIRVLAPLWALLLGGWLWLRMRSTGAALKWGIRMLSLLLLAGTIAWTTPQTVEGNNWETFEVAIFKEKLGKEKIFLDFTADWCPTCKALEATVLTPENIRRWKSKYGVTFIRVDLTERSMEGEGVLRALGSMSIPTAALFRPGEVHSPLVLRDLFTESQLESILKSWEK